VALFRQVKTDALIRCNQKINECRGTARDSPSKKRKRKYSDVNPLLIREINAIGNNLNQISRRVNENQKFDVVVELASIEAQLESLLNAHQIHK